MVILCQQKRRGETRMFKKYREIKKLVGKGKQTPPMKIAR